MNEALLALPNSTVTGQVKFTEQGEAIAEKYANPRIAERNIEQMLNAQLRARKGALDQPEEEVRDEWVEAMETMADAARREYRDLLESEGFVRYFEQATPITVIEDLDLGSRPASRSGERTVEDLRAIRGCSRGRSRGVSCRAGTRSRAASRPISRARSHAPRNSRVARNAVPRTVERRSRSRRQSRLVMTEAAKRLPNHRETTAMRRETTAGRWKPSRRCTRVAVLPNDARQRGALAVPNRTRDRRALRRDG